MLLNFNVGIIYPARLLTWGASTSESIRINNKKSNIKSSQQNKLYQNVLSKFTNTTITTFSMFNKRMKKHFLRRQDLKKLSQNVRENASIAGAKKRDCFSRKPISTFNCP